VDACKYCKEYHKPFAMCEAYVKSLSVPMEVDKPEKVIDQTRRMNCDWCGKLRGCNNLVDTHYWVCMTCAVSRF